MSKPNVYYVILAGGSGQRLWPLSRKKLPKQLMVLGEYTLLEQAINRLTKLATKQQIWISTTQEYAQTITEAAGARVGNVTIEPGSRDTGPAILFSCLEIYERDPHAVIVFLPADPFIPVNDYKKYADFLEHAVDFVCTHDAITLLGVTPTYPATGYGYIEYDALHDQAPYPVLKFREKPSTEVALQYVEDGNKLWNIGVFCGKASIFIDEYKKHAPEIYADVQRYKAGEIAYNTVKSESVDYAIMEHSKSVHVLPVDFSWCDVGNIEIFLSLKQQYNTLDNNFIAIESHNNLVDVPKKLVALVGVDDLCVVETADALLITKRNKAERVRSIVNLLKTSRFDSYL